MITRQGITLVHDRVHDRACVEHSFTNVDRAGESLRRAALSLDRSRRHAPKDPNEALGYWKAMVEGEWTLVERFESDGRRILVARANAPETHKQHALTESEQKVVSLVALCHPSKLVAHELGNAESTVSELLGNAMRKLGVRSKVELVELHNALVNRDQA